jgi:REP element-mobilizing transposase RayT
MSYTRLRYHFIFATKRRRPCFTPEVEPFVYEQLRFEAQQCGSDIKLLGGVEDHIHSIIAVHPTVAVSDFARDVKKQTTKAIRAKFPQLHDFEWCVGYGAITVNPDEMSTLWTYIENQKQHHARHTLIHTYELPTTTSRAAPKNDSVTEGKPSRSASQADGEAHPRRGPPLDTSA